MYGPQPHLQWLSLIFLVVIVPYFLGFTVQQSEARPLSPNMKTEGRKNHQSSFSANKGEILGPRGPPVLYSAPPHIGNHEMSSAGPRVQYVSLKRGPVPPSTPNPPTNGP